MLKGYSHERILYIHPVLGGCGPKCQPLYVVVAMSFRGDTLDFKLCDFYIRLFDCFIVFGLFSWSGLHISYIWHLFSLFHNLAYSFTHCPFKQVLCVFSFASPPLPPVGFKSEFSQHVGLNQPRNMTHAKAAVLALPLSPFSLWGFEGGRDKGDVWEGGRTHPISSIWQDKPYLSTKLIVTFCSLLDIP